MKILALTCPECGRILEVTHDDKLHCQSCLKRVERDDAKRGSIIINKDLALTVVHKDI